MPDGEVPPRARDVAMSHRVAVGEQNGGYLSLGLDTDGVDREHIGPVEEEGDAAEAFRLALSAVGAARQVKTGKRSVGLRVAIGDELEREGMRGGTRNGKRALFEFVVGRGERLAVEGNAFERETFAVEHQRP